MTTSEKATQKSIDRPHLSVHHTSFLWASFACQVLVRSTTHRIPALSGAGLPFLRRSRRPTNEPPAHGEWWPSRRRDPYAPLPDPATLRAAPRRRGSPPTAASRDGWPGR